MLHRTIAISIASLAVFAGWACSSSSPQCQVGADCASGACDSSGHCVPVTTGGDDSGSSTLEASVEAGVESSTEASSGGGEGGICQPNNDGVVTLAELPMAAGLHANFLIAENVTMNTAGTAEPDGTIDWDFSAALSGDHTVIITTDALTGQWFASQFTSATYTSKLSDTETFLGVYQGTTSGLLLQGVVTPTTTSPETDVSYTPPAEIIDVPLQVGTTWTSTSTVKGTADGIPDSTYTEKYASVVDAKGTLKVPYGTFQVLRVQTTLTRTVVPLTDIETTQTMTFVAECFGPVARLTSQTTTAPEAVPGNAFTSVAEAWRLSP
jgi:hypothetical protein